MKSNKYTIINVEEIYDILMAVTKDAVAGDRSPESFAALAAIYAFVDELENYLEKRDKDED